MSNTQTPLPWPTAPTAPPPVSSTSQPVSPAPPNYLPYCIVGVLIGLIPLAIIAIYNASRVNVAWQSGDVLIHQKATRYASRARLWAIITLGTGAVLWALGLALVIYNMVTGSAPANAVTFMAIIWLMSVGSLVMLLLQPKPQ